MRVWTSVTLEQLVNIAGVIENRQRPTLSRDIDAVQGRVESQYVGVLSNVTRKDDLHALQVEGKELCVARARDERAARIGVDAETMRTLATRQTRRAHDLVGRGIDADELIPRADRHQNAVRSWIELTVSDVVSDLNFA